MTREELHFATFLCQHGPNHFVFEKDGWLLLVSDEFIIERNHPRIFAIKFGIETLSGDSYLQAWPDVYGESSGLQAIDKDKTLLDVGRGDTLRWSAGGSNKLQTVSDVFIGRSWPQFPEREAVPNGRWFLEKYRVN